MDDIREIARNSDEGFYGKLCFVVELVWLATKLKLVNLNLSPDMTN